MSVSSPSRKSTTRWRKKPVVIEAIQWDESKETLDYLRTRGMKWSGHTGHRDNPDLVRNLRIKTLESGDRSHLVDKDDWIIRGVKGEFYACKPDIFAMTYEPASALSEKAMRVVGKYGPEEHGKAWWNGLVELHHGEAIVVVQMDDEEATRRINANRQEAQPVQESWEGHGAHDR